MKTIMGFFRNLFQGTSRFFQDAVRFVLEARDELRKVTWPTRDEVTSFTMVVIVSVVILSMYLWLVDTGLLAIIKLVMK